MFPFVLFLLFLILKLTGVVTMGWIWVTAPLWITMIIWGLWTAIVFITFFFLALLEGMSSW